MATPRVWKNVAVAMQSILGAAIAATAVSKASPGVVTSASAPATGAFVLMTAQGMSQIDGRVFRVVNLTATTFSLEGEDTTGYDTFTGGTWQLITFGTSITSATSISSSGGDIPFIDTTTIHDSVRSQIPGLPNAASYSIDNIWDVADAGQAALRLAGQSGAPRCFRFTFGPGGPIMVFNGNTAASGLPAGQAQALVTTPAVITISKSPTFYPS